MGDEPDELGWKRPPRRSSWGRPERSDLRWFLDLVSREFYRSESFRREIHEARTGDHPGLRVNYSSEPVKKER